jgi:hypothetical protein
MRVSVSAAGRLWAVVLLGLLAGCKTWQPATLSPESLLSDERPAAVRVTVAGGSTMTLKNPLIVNDSIVSSSAPQPGLAFAPPRLGVASEDVRSLEVARFSPGRTLGFVAVIAAASIGWATVAGESAGGSLPPDGPLPKDPALGFWRGVQLVWRLTPGA